MSVNLKKGQKVDLRKDNGESLRNVMIGLGWDEKEDNKGGFFSKLFSVKQDIDCDASVIVCRDGKLADNSDIVFYNNLKHKSGAIQHMGDNRTGDGDGDDEQVSVKLADVPSVYDKIVFVVTIYQAGERNQHFGLIKNAFIRIVDNDTNKEMCRFDLTDDYSGSTAMIFGEVYRKDGGWKFNAIGQGTQDHSVSAIAKRYE